MAVPGSKLTDFLGLVSSCSEDHSCDPCLTIGQHIKAHGFCVNCREYLCNDCFECHQRTQSSNDHELVDKNYTDERSFSRIRPSDCTDKCHLHKEEFIKFFCKHHEEFGCTDCLTMSHITCDLEYIPDKCAGIKESDECRQVMRELDRKQKEEDENIIQQANIQNSPVDSSDENATEEIIYSRKGIDDQLDKNQKQMELPCDERKSTEIKKIQTVNETCTSVASDVDGEEVLEEKNVSYGFGRSKDLQNTLSIVDDFWTHDAQNTDLPGKKKRSNRLTLIRKIKVKTKSNEYPFSFTGCAVLNRNKVLLTDYNNRKLIVVDTEREVRIEKKPLVSDPWDIAVLPQDQVAVTMPFEKEILVMSTAGKLTPVRKIKVKGECYGITYGEDHLYVACNPASVLSMDVQGNDQVNIFQKRERYENHKDLHYCVLSDDCSTIYLSSYTSHSVLRLTLTGELLSIFNHGDLKEPEGMVLLDDGSLMVCSYRKHAILRISGDLKHCQDVPTVDNPQSICYNHHRQEVYVGTFNSKRLLVFSLK
ncbi:uncharacterized protein LOC128549938 [Mercenaria mercenaria]|uniref:uncharacterized protein LOC128549938 n=1 Tax=Mercenaria mercenaria TaxID=6596 RepID=UPI00234E8378|nr:uncharacterized protein LOC128549938 [Mercenaria mercenaria]